MLAPPICSHILFLTKPGDLEVFYTRSHQVPERTNGVGKSKPGRTGSPVGWVPRHRAFSNLFTLVTLTHFKACLGCLGRDNGNNAHKNKYESLEVLAVVGVNGWLQYNKQ